MAKLSEKDQKTCQEIINDFINSGEYRVPDGMTVEYFCDIVPSLVEKSAKKILKRKYAKELGHWEVEEIYSNVMEYLYDD